MKKPFRLGKGVNQYKRTYNKEIGMLIGLLLGLAVMYLASLTEGSETYVQEEVIVAVHVKATVPVTKENSKKELENKIKHYFPRSWRDMIPTAYAESGMNHNAQGWNCWYNKDKTIVYTEKVKGSHSTSCKKEHRKYSWSIDCGVLMKNHIGIRTCPVVSVDDHLKEMAALSKVQGKCAWFAYPKWEQECRRK